MAHNFRETGNIYISKAGNDANAGTSADLPKATFADYTAAVQVVGSGVYKGAFSLSSSILLLTTWLADDLVVINCTADFVVGVPAVGNRAKTLGKTGRSGIDFLIKLNGFTLLNATSTGVPNVYARFYNTIIENGNVSFGPRYTSFEKCVFKNIGTADTNPLDLSFNKCQFFNTTNIPAISFVDSYANSSSTIKKTAYFTSPATQFKNNNFQGILNIAGIDYELKRDKNGNAIDPNPGIADLVTIDATVYDRGNFSQDPLLNNISKGDYFSVDEMSPNLLAATAGSNIGDVLKAKTIKATDTQFTTGATVVDLVLSSGDYIFSGAGTFGTVVSAPIQIAPVAQQIRRVDIAQLFNFDSLQTKGTAENKDVVISDNYTALTAGANPRRMTFEMRWSTKATEPVTAADWDNNSYITAGDYAKFEHFKQPMIDTSGKGNGEPDYTSVGAVPILAKWIQVKITIFNGIG